MRYFVQNNALLVLLCLGLSVTSGVMTKAGAGKEQGLWAQQLHTTSSAAKAAGMLRSDASVIFHDRFEVIADTQPGDPDSTQERISDHLPWIIDSSTAAMESLAQSETMYAATESLVVLQEVFALGESDPAETEAIDTVREEESPGQEFADFLNEVIFTDENYEGDGFYRIPVELLCPPDESGEPSPECVDQIDALEPRLRAVLAGEDGVDIHLTLGPDRIDPLGVELRENSTTLVIDIGATAEFAEFLAVLTSETTPDDPDLTFAWLADLVEMMLDDAADVLEGVVSATLLVHGEEHIGLEAAIREEILVEDNDTSFSLAATDPLLAFEADGIEVSASASIDIGRLQLLAPWSELNPDSEASGNYVLDWQGFSADATLEDSTSMLEIDNIGFGQDTSTISLDDHVLVSVDLNKDQGREFFLAMLPDDEAHPDIEFDPGIDLVIGVDLQPLADAGDEVPPYMIDEIYRFRITGSSPSIRTEAAQNDFPGGIRVLSGQLSLSNDDGDEVVVDEGWCLIASEPEEDDHPLIGSFAESACE